MWFAMISRGGAHAVEPITRYWWTNTLTTSKSLRCRAFKPCCTSWRQLSGSSRVRARCRWAIAARRSRSPAACQCSRSVEIHAGSGSLGCNGAVLFPVLEHGALLPPGGLLPGRFLFRGDGCGFSDCSCFDLPWAGFLLAAIALPYLAGASAVVVAVSDDHTPDLGPASHQARIQCERGSGIESAPDLRT